MKKLLTASFVWLVMMSIAVSAQTAGKKHKKKKHPAPVEANTDMLGDLQGKWASLDDKKTFFVIREHDQQNFYADQVVDTAFINFYDKCPEHVSAKDALRKAGRYFVTRSKNYKIHCYRILKLNTKSLELVNLPKGNVLKYKKQYYQ